MFFPNCNRQAEKFKEAALPEFRRMKAQRFNRNPSVGKIVWLELRSRLRRQPCQFIVKAV
jgi:hypothetical protein